jgi:putative ABC transport system substrate-binding protein
MKRRQAILAAGALAASPLIYAQAQRVRRIGILVPSAYGAGMVVAFSKRLGALGWVEGRNLTIEVRNGEAHLGRLPMLAAELVRLKVDLIVTVTTPATRAVKAAAGTIPVVFAWVGDPVASKFVASLARPGGTVTGLSIIAAEVAPKQFELLKALVPGLARVAQLHDPKYMGGPLNATYIEAAARAGIALIPVVASTAAELEPAFAAAVRERAGAMVIPPRPLHSDQNERIVQLAKQFRMPCAAQTREFPAAGGLVSYGSDLNDGFLRTATYVDKILRGAKPSDLPVEQADRFELVVNRRTATELGLTIPQVVLLQATEVIE